MYVCEWESVWVGEWAGGRVSVHAICVHLFVCMCVCLHAHSDIILFNQLYFAYQCTDSHIQLDKKALQMCNIALRGHQHFAIENFLCQCPCLRPYCLFPHKQTLAIKMFC